MNLRAFRGPQEKAEAEQCLQSLKTVSCSAQWDMQNASSCAVCCHSARVLYLVTLELALDGNTQE